MAYPKWNETQNKNQLQQKRNRKTWKKISFICYYFVLLFLFVFLRFFSIEVDVIVQFIFKLKGNKQFGRYFVVVVFLFSFWLVYLISSKLETKWAKEKTHINDDESANFVRIMNTDCDRKIEKDFRFCFVCFWFSIAFNHFRIDRCEPKLYLAI